MSKESNDSGRRQTPEPGLVDFMRVYVEDQKRREEDQRRRDEENKRERIPGKGVSC